MEAEEVIAQAYSALIEGDTGTGGLYDSNADADQKVRGGVFLIDSTDAKRPADRPYIAIEISSREISPFPGSSGTADFFDNVVTLWVIDDRDERADTTLGNRRANRVLARIRAIFQNTTLSAIDDTDDATRKWYFNPTARVNFKAASPTGKEVRLPISFRQFVSKGTK